MTNLNRDVWEFLYPDGVPDQDVDTEVDKVSDSDLKYLVQVEQDFQNYLASLEAEPEN